MTCLSSSPICEYTRDMGATPSSRGNLDNLQWYKVLHFNLDNGVEGAMKFGMLGYAYGHCGTWMTWVRRHDGVGKPVDGTEKITRWRV
ncbi:hypothetical protein BMONG18_1239, partial [Bifidobacterium mongoliense]